MQSVQIAMGVGMGRFTEVRCKIVDDTKGELGRSAARNAAVKASDANWLFFLDADDMMHPSAMLNVKPHMQLEAVWGQIVEDREGCMLQRYQVPEIENFETLIAYDPFITLQMGHFVRADVAKANPFNESMHTGEDWDYYLRLWKAHDCAKIDAPFMINVRGQHSTGPKSATGREWMATVNDLLNVERENVKKIKELRATA